jgi:predicted nucleic acid-binding protein
MLFRAVLDANVLFSATVRDIFLEVALHGLYRPLWSDMILLEARDALVRTNKKSQTSADLLVYQVETAFPSSLITDYEHLLGEHRGLDSGDEHVLAAARSASADAIVTFNIGDFPRDMFSQFGIELKHPDDFLQDQLDLNPYVVIQALGGLLGYYQLPPRNAEELTSNLSRSQLPRFGVALSPYLRQIDEFANSIREAMTLD